MAIQFARCNAMLSLALDKQGLGHADTWQKQRLMKASSLIWLTTSHLNMISMGMTTWKTSKLVLKPTSLHDNKKGQQMLSFFIFIYLPSSKLTMMIALETKVPSVPSSFRTSKPPWTILIYPVP